MHRHERCIPICMYQSSPLPRVFLTFILLFIKILFDFFSHRPSGLVDIEPVPVQWYADHRRTLSPWWNIGSVHWHACIHPCIDIWTPLPMEIFSNIRHCYAYIHPIIGIQAHIFPTKRQNSHTNRAADIYDSANCFTLEWAAHAVKLHVHYTYINTYTHRVIFFKKTKLIIRLLRCNNNLSVCHTCSSCIPLLLGFHSSYYSVPSNHYTFIHYEGKQLQIYIYYT